MYRIKEIQEKLLHLVGWEQSFDPTKAINNELTQTESGLYFQGAHPLVTLDNIRSIIPDDFVYKYPKWNMILEYKQGTKVCHNNEIWIALKDSQNEEPTKGDLSPDFNEDYGNEYWRVYNYLSDYLERLTRNGISQMVQTFTQNKRLDKETKNLLEHRTFFDGAGRIKEVIHNSGKLCGYEIVPVRSMGVTTKIERIGLQMIGGTGMVRLYLFHSSQFNPIKTIDVEFTQKNGGFQWFPMKELYLPYINDEINAGGSWFLCYNQNELPPNMEAINISKDWSREPCGTCNMGNVQLWKELTKYLQINPFAYNAPEDFKEYPELWDIAQNLWTNTRNYGINVEISVGCDLTDFIISQRQIFATVIQRQVSAIVLRTLAMNPSVRVNRNQSNASRMEILYELDGNVEGRPGGLGYELKKAYEALQLDTQGIDRICLSCNNHGVRYRTV